MRSGSGNSKVNPEASFAALALPEYTGLLHFARTLDPEGAEDLVQEAYLAGLKYFPRFCGGSLFSLLATIVKHLHRERFRNYGGAVLRRRSASLDGMKADCREQGRLFREPPPLVERQTPELLLMDEEERDLAMRLVNAALAELPDWQRQLVHLVYFQDMDYAVIAELKGLCVHSVRQYCYDARKAMCRHIERQLQDLGLRPGAAILRDGLKAEDLAQWRRRHADGRRKWENKRLYATRSWNWKNGNAATRGRTRDRPAVSRSGESCHKLSNCAAGR
jgi:RNA polymerase sigma factor (sigma-70 family)